MITVLADSDTSYVAEYEVGPDNKYGYIEYRISLIDNCVWPGDVDTNLVVNHFDLLPLGLVIGESGPARTEMDIDWYGHEAENWSAAIPGYDANTKHADCNGDGEVTLVDTLAIIQNWGSTHKSIINVDAQDGLPIFLETDTIPGEGISVNIPLVIGTMDTMANDIYGIAFSINFDPELVADNSTSLNLIDSWLSGGNNEYVIIQKEFPAEGRVDVGITRTDQTNVSGFGQVADFVIIMEDDILRSRADGGIEMEMSISNVRLINVKGNEISTAPRNSTAFVIDESVGTNNRYENLEVEIYPNPISKDRKLNIKTDLDLRAFELVNIQGSLLQSGDIQLQKEITIDTSLPAGLYFLKFKSEDDRFVVKKIMLK